MKTAFRTVIDIILIFPCLILTVAYAQPQSHTKKYQGWPTDMHFWEYLPPGYHEDENRRFPLIIFFHGYGERANTPPTIDYFAELNAVLRHGPPKEINEQMSTNDSVMCFRVNAAEEAARAPINFRSLVSEKGLYLFRIIKAFGEFEIRRIVFNE